MPIKEAEPNIFLLFSALAIVLIDSSRRKYKYR